MIFIANNCNAVNIAETKSRWKFRDVSLPHGVARLTKAKANTSRRCFTDPVIMPGAIQATPPMTLSIIRARQMVVTAAGIWNFITIARRTCVADRA